MIVSVSLYHDRAICGTLCLSNVGDESFFVGMKGKTDAEWMQKGWVMQVTLSIPLFPSLQCICCPSLGPKEAELYRSPHLGSFALWFPVGFRQ